MPLTINEDAFEACHENFLGYMQEKAHGEPFTNFQRPFLVDDEISYKWAAYRRGLDALDLDKWNNWKAGQGRILQTVKEACAPSIGANWLTRRFEISMEIRMRHCIWLRAMNRSEDLKKSSKP